MVRILALVSLLALPAFAEGPAPAGDAAAAPPAGGAATTATPKGSGTKKEKPAVEAPAAEQAPAPAKK